MKQSKILIADDSQQHLQVLSEALCHVGCSVIAASDGERALLTALLRVPDLILMDTALPKLNGLAVARCLKSNPLTRCIPIIFVSSQGLARDRVEGLRAGGVDYVVKPFYSEELLARVRIHLTLSRGHSVKPLS